MKKTHKEKVKLAKKLRTRQELKDKVSIWLTKAWEERKQAIRDRIARRIIEIKRRKELRKLNKKKGGNHVNP